MLTDKLLNPLSAWVPGPGVQNPHGVHGVRSLRSESDPHTTVSREFDQDTTQQYEDSLSYCDHDMEKRNCEEFVVKKALTERYRKNYFQKSY